MGFEKEKLHHTNVLDKELQYTKCLTNLVI